MLPSGWVKYGDLESSSPATTKTIPRSSRSPSDLKICFRYSRRDIPETPQISPSHQAPSKPLSSSFCDKGISRDQWSDISPNERVFFLIGNIASPPVHPQR